MLDEIKMELSQQGSFTRNHRTIKYSGRVLLLLQEIQGTLH
jgi:hypothetical protein